MPRVQQELVNVNFSKGLITETGPLGYPDNSCKDLLNIDLDRNGSARVRNGLVVDTFRNIFNVANDSSFSVHFWNNPDETDNNFVVVQTGFVIQCLSTNGEYIGETSYTAETFSDGRAYSRVPRVRGVSRESEPTNMSSVQSRGCLYMTSPETGPFYLQFLPNGRLGHPDYNNENNIDNDPVVQIVSIRPKYRDLEGLEDGFDTETRPTEDVAEHRYNVLNMGYDLDEYYFWNQGADRDNYSDFRGGTFPSKADAYWSAYGVDPNSRNPREKYYPYLAISQKLTSPAPMGRFILDVLNPNRAIVSGVSELPQRSRAKGPNSINFFAGRVWYAGFVGGDFEDNILFSAVIPVSSSVNYESDIANYIDEDVGKCYQKNDPTAREVNDLVDDDGGVIPIPGLGTVRGMVALKAGLLVISDNGVWSISGGIDPFSANNYTVNKVTTVGCICSKSIVELEGGLCYWGFGGIVYIGEERGQYSAVSLTDSTIKDYYMDIPLGDKRDVNGHYDIVDKKVYWIIDGNKCLVYDTILQAFYRYRFANSIQNIFPLTIVSTKSIRSNDAVIVGNDTVTIDEDNVVIDRELDKTYSSQVVFVVRNNNTIMFARFDSKDSGNYYDLIPKEYSEVAESMYPVQAHLEIGASSFGDLMRRKEVFRVFVYLETKETLTIPNYKVSDNTIVFQDGFKILDEQSCWVQGRWEWSSRPTSGKFSAKQQAYRQPKLEVISGTSDVENIILDEENVRLYGASLEKLYSISSPNVLPVKEVTTSRMRIRGSGKTLNLYFENEPGKGFHLLGWAAPAMINQRP